MSTLRASLTVAATTALAAAAAAPAHAWTVASADQTVTFTAAAGELNAPTVKRAGNANDVFAIQDPGGTAAAGQSCGVNAELQIAECAAIGDTRLVFRLGDRSEKLLLGDGVANLVRLDMDGGDGNDTLSNQGRPGTLSGGAGSDVLRPGLGTDTVSGGPGVDVVDYSDRTTGVLIELRTLNGQVVGQSGAPGEKDVLQLDLEGAFGGSGADTINTGAANDQVVPGKGKDVVSTATGDDTIDARDGEKDTIQCGSGTDKVYADTIDSVGPDCDTVTRTGGVSLAPPAPGVVPDPPAPPAEQPLDPSQPPADGTPAPAPGPTPGPDGMPAAPDTRRPVVSALTLAPKTIGIAGKRTRTVLRFGVSEPVSVAVAVKRLAAGRRSGAKCVVPTAKLAKRKAEPCVRTVAVTTFTRAGLDGDVALRLSARVGGKVLKSGSRYRLTVVATDAAGNRSAATSATLKVVRR